MKVGITLLTVELDRLGGLNLRLAALIKGLAKLGHEVVTIQAKDALSRSREFYRSVADLPVRWVEADFQLGDSLLRWTRLPLLWLLPFAKLVPEDVDVLDLWDPLFDIPRGRSYPVVFSHNHFAPYIWEHFQHCGPRTIGMVPELPFLYGILRGRGKRVDGYITETEPQRRWLMEKHAIPSCRVKVVPPGFDAASVEQLRQVARLDADSQKAIVFSGRLHRWKGVYELVAAFSLFARDHPEWTLHFVGDGPAQQGLYQEVQKRGLQEQVIFWGRMHYDRALQIVASAQILSLPSYIESFPLSLLEAMALGVPAIATDVGGIRHHLIEPGTTGLLIPPKDPEALYCALAQLASDPGLRLRLSIKGREKVKDLTIENMISATTDFYVQVASA